MNNTLKKKKNKTEVDFTPLKSGSTNLINCLTAWQQGSVLETIK